MTSNVRRITPDNVSNAPTYNVRAYRLARPPSCSNDGGEFYKKLCGRGTLGGSMMDREGFRLFQTKQEINTIKEIMNLCKKEDFCLDVTRECENRINRGKIPCFEKLFDDSTSFGHVRHFFVFKLYSGSAYLAFLDNPQKFDPANGWGAVGAFDNFGNRLSAIDYTDFYPSPPKKSLRQANTVSRDNGTNDAQPNIITTTTTTRKAGDISDDRITTYTTVISF